jgi:hypothetical protein
MTDWDGPPHEVIKPGAFRGTTATVPVYLGNDREHAIGSAYITGDGSQIHITLPERSRVKDLIVEGLVSLGFSYNAKRILPEQEKGENDGIGTTHA